MRFYPSILPFLFILGLLSGCKKENDREPGSVVAGEAGPGLRTEVYDPPLVATPNSPASMVVPIDRARGVSMTFFCTSHSTNSTGYWSNFARSVGEAAGNVQFMVQASMDTTWLCDVWSSDSLSHEITYFNALSGFSCPDAASLHETTEVAVPVGQAEGSLIGSVGDWRPGPFDFQGHLENHHYIYGGPYDMTTSNVFRTKGFVAGITFLPFRYDAEGTWRYGYLKLRATESLIEVFGFGVEDPSITEE